MIVRSADYGSNGQIRLDGAWMAGFHFNSAIMRLSAVYHRFLRVITNNHQKGEWVDDLLKQLTYPWTPVEIVNVHKEVNKDRAEQVPTPEPIPRAATIQGFGGYRRSGSVRQGPGG